MKKEHRDRSAHPHDHERESPDDHGDPAKLLQRAAADAASLSPRDVEQLQRTVGNQAVDELVNMPVQRKIGNRGAENAWVWWETGGANERGKIVRILLRMRVSASAGMPIP